MNANNVTPALRQAILLAHSAPKHTLTRCCGGFHNAARGPAGKPATVTRRTANTLHLAMLFDFDDRDSPSAMTLTERGVRLAKELSADPQAVRQ